MDDEWIPEVGLGADEYDGCAWAEVADLGQPLERHVGEAVSVVDWEADDDDVGVGIGQWSQLFVVFLAGSVPQRKVYSLTVDLRATQTDGQRQFIFYNTPHRQYQGRSDGGISGYIPPKSVYLKFFMWLFWLVNIYTHPNQIPGYASGQ